jgi:hypothetical protein
MLTLKSQLTCSYCSKIVKDPIDLPCDDSICREHLSDRDVLKENKIKCNKCNQEFQVKDNHFLSHKTIKNLIESQSYLNEEEIKLKHDLKVSIQKFYQFYDEFIQSRTKLESDVFDHFQEIRFQIDEHRERLKVRIDEIALTMIDRAKKSEEIYLKNLKEGFSSFDNTKSLEHELNQIEETFRNPNLLIETIREMQQQQDESVKDIQLKLNQINKVKAHLKATNDFQSNVSPLNLIDTSFFGLIKMNACWSNVNSFKGQILTDDQEYFDLINLCEFSPNDKWSLLYRGTRDGFGSSDFHSKCDGHSNTLTIVKAIESSFIFGGFTTVAWESSAKGKWKSDSSAFLFSLTNKDNQALKMKVDQNRHQYAIFCNSSNGPRFGDDIILTNNANITMECESNLSFAYKHPQYEDGTNAAQTFLAGSYVSQLDEIEVYEKE